jgi:hypothetical protein
VNDWITAFVSEVPVRTTEQLLVAKAIPIRQPSRIVQRTRLPLAPPRDASVARFTGVVVGFMHKMLPGRPWFCRRQIATTLPECLPSPPPQTHQQVPAVAPETTTGGTPMRMNSMR